MTSVLKFVKTTARGRVVGESHGLCRYADTLVEQVRAGHAAGLGHLELARRFGVSKSTVQDWVSYRRRKPHARVVVKRVKPAHP